MCIRDSIKSGVCVTHPAVEILEPNVTSLKPSVDLNGLLVCGNASIQSEPFSFLHHSSNEGEINWFRTYKPINQNNHKITKTNIPVSYTHLRAHETVLDLVCRLLLEKKKT